MKRSKTMIRHDDQRRVLVQAGDNAAQQPIYVLVIVANRVAILGSFLPDRAAGATDP